jgi:hypothetical protein
MKTLEQNLFGKFDLQNQNRYFNGWPTLKNDATKIVMSFNVEAHPNEIATKD